MGTRGHIHPVRANCTSHAGRRAGGYLRHAHNKSHRVIGHHEGPLVLMALPVTRASGPGQLPQALPRLCLCTIGWNFTSTHVHVTLETNGWDMGGLGYTRAGLKEKHGDIQSHLYGGMHAPVAGTDTLGGALAVSPPELSGNWGLSGGEVGPRQEGHTVTGPSRGLSPEPRSPFQPCVRPSAQ